uniref:Uncharacterized protein n=1 Tax=Arundo donax TaxID=35708 RepID=A0A0A8YV65_ARUDO
MCAGSARGCRRWRRTGSPCGRPSSPWEPRRRRSCCSRRSRRSSAGSPPRHHFRLCP